MTNLQKVYKLILNMLDHHVDISFSYNHDLEEYQLHGLSLKYGSWRIFMNISDLPYLCIGDLYCTETDRSWLMVEIDDIDNFLNGIRESYIDWLLEGIE